MEKLNPDEYYKARIEAERKAAVTASCPQARRAHEEMALAYEQMMTGPIPPATANNRSSKTY